MKDESLPPKRAMRLLRPLFAALEVQDVTVRLPHGGHLRVWLNPATNMLEAQDEDRDCTYHDSPNGGLNP